MASEPTVLIYDRIDWDDPRRTARPGTAPPKELVARAKKTGARRKKLARGEGGFFMNRSVLPAGFRVPTHHHNHDELMVVLKGGCEFDDGVATLGADDSIVIHAGYRYGFTCGPEGMEFLTIRRGEAAMSVG
ncbi:MAG: cupin domain-containing protein [Myxococcota bacterium]